jgi:hypothetical protein
MDEFSTFNDAYFEPEIAAAAKGMPENKRRLGTGLILTLGALTIIAMATYNKQSGQNAINSSSPPEASAPSPIVEARPQPDATTAPAKPAAPPYVARNAPYP